MIFPENFFFSSPQLLVTGDLNHNGNNLGPKVTDKKFDFFLMNKGFCSGKSPLKRPMM